MITNRLGSQNIGLMRWLKHEDLRGHEGSRTDREQHSQNKIVDAKNTTHALSLTTAE